MPPSHLSLLANSSVPFMYQLLLLPLGGKRILIEKVGGAEHITGATLGVYLASHRVQIFNLATGSALKHTSRACLTESSTKPRVWALCSPLTSQAPAQCLTNSRCSVNISWINKRKCVSSHITPCGWIM